MENQSPSQPSVPVVPVTAKQVTLPNSTEVLMLGIISIPTCCCIGIFGLASGIIALVLGKKAIALYESNPEAYTSSSYDNAKAGYICGIIGTALSALYVMFLIIYIIALVFYGAFITSAFQNAGAQPW